MSNRTLKLRLGLFVVLAGVLFAVLIVLFGSLPGLFKRTTYYIVRFNDAPGLTSGAPVRRSGVRIGTVGPITLDEERGIVRVQLAIDAPYTIRRNEQATLVTGLLGSDTSIDLIPRPIEDGEAVDREPLEAGAEMVGTRAFNVTGLLKGASEVVPTTQETLNDIRKSIQRLEKLANRAEKAIPVAEETMREYRDLARTVRNTTLPELQQTNLEYRALANAARTTMLPELQKTNLQVREFVQVVQNQVPELMKTNTEVREFVRGAREMLPEINRAVEEYRLLGRDVRTALPEVMKTNKEVREFVRGAREMLPNIDRTIDDYRQLAVDVRKLMPTVRGTIEDFGAAARNATRLLERADVMLQDNREQIESTIQNLSAAAARLSRLLSEDNIRNATQALANIRTASDSFPRLSKGAEDLMVDGRTMVKRLNEFLSKADSSLADIQKITRPFALRSDRIAKNVDESADRINHVLGDVRALMRVVDKSDGTLRKFLTDPSLYNNIDHAAAMITKMLPRLDRIMKDFEVFADKLARHPELLGARGVVSPSNGLKNPPTPPLAPSSGTIIHAPGYTPKP